MNNDEIIEAYKEIIKAQATTINSLQDIIKAQTDYIVILSGVQVAPTTTI